MPESIIKGLRDYFNACPLMQGCKLNVDYLPENTKKAGVQFSISPTPGEPDMRRYMSRSSMRQFPFILRTVNDWGTDVLQNLGNSGFCEDLAEWMLEQSGNHNLPLLPEGMQATRLVVVTSGYLFVTTPAAGKYQIQCRLEYFRKGVRRYEA